MNDLQTVLIRKKIKYLSVALLLVALLVLGLLLSVSFGTMNIDVKSVFSVILSRVLNVDTTVTKSVDAVVWNIRLPRILCSIFVGMGLAVSGVIFQGILQNPLADPYTLGISTGASFGASLALFAAICFGFYIPVTLSALLWAFITLLFVIAIAKKGNSLESTNLIIAGIIISSILSSGVSFIKMLSGENVGAIVFWIMGSFSSTDWSQVALVAPVVTLCTIVAVLLSDRLDIMALGDSNANALGVNTNRLRFIYLILGSTMTAVCVSVCGVIGFVGLVVPHLLRFWLTANNRIIMPLSALLGGLLLMCADSITRVLTAGEIPVGVLTTLIGGPFFIFIFTQRGGSKNG